MHEQLIKQECLEKNNQRGITWKLRKGKQFLYTSHFHCSDIILIPVKLHQDIPNSY